MTFHRQQVFLLPNCLYLILLSVFCIIRIKSLAGTRYRRIEAFRSIPCLLKDALWIYAKVPLFKSLGKTRRCLFAMFAHPVPIHFKLWNILHIGTVSRFNVFAARNQISICNKLLCFIGQQVVNERFGVLYIWTGFQNRPVG